MLVFQVLSDKEEPLSNVLLSLSGGNQYRNNNVTDDAGAVTFSGLVSL